MATGQRPQFFLPLIAEAEKAEEYWHAIKTFANESHCGSVTDHRIFRLEYVHNSNEMEAQVGEPHPYGHPFTFDYVPDYEDPKAGEFVVAILENERGPFYVCTHNRGVVRGEPILVGTGEVRAIVYFDGYGPHDRPRASCAPVASPRSEPGQNR